MSLIRRTIHAFGLGRGTTAVTDGGYIRTVQAKFPTLGNILDSIPFMQHYGFASRPHASCDHAVVAMHGSPSQSVAIASNDQNFQISLIEGESALHDDQAQSVHITRAGIVWTDKSGNTLTSTAAGFVLQDAFGNRIVTGSTGILLGSCTGIISVDNEIAGTEEGGTGASFTGTIKSTDDIIANVGGAEVSLLNHVHSNAGGTGDSGPPVPGT